jgi:photosystem II stability/assembly factor-like uncharacterized protein
LDSASSRTKTVRFLVYLTAGLLIVETASCQSQKSKTEAQPQARPVSSVPQYWVSSFPVGQRVYGLYADVKDPDVIYACTHRGLFKTSNRGELWLAVYTGQFDYMALAQSKSSPNVIYLGFAVGETGGLLKSIDGGRIWQEIGHGDIQHAVRDLGVDPENSEIVYVRSAVVNVRTSPLNKSLNGGKTWGIITPQGVFDNEETKFSRSFWVDPVKTGHLFLACLSGSPTTGSLLESQDGGGTWTPKNFPKMQLILTRWGAHNDGNENRWEYLFPNPTRGQNIVGITSWVGDGVYHVPGLVASGDGGESWKDVTIYRKSQMTVASINALIWSRTSGGAIYIGNDDGLFASNNIGTSWRLALPYGTKDIAEAQSGELYAATVFGILKSSDGGKSWHESGVGLPIYSGAWTQSNMPDSFEGFRQGESSHLFLLEAIDKENIYVGGRGGWWTSSDGGVSWSWHALVANSAPGGIGPDILSPREGPNVRQVLVGGDGTLFLNVVTAGAGSTAEAQILKVQPDGRIIKVSVNRLPNTIAASPSDPQVLYMTASEGTVYSRYPGGGKYLMKSEDGGFSWGSIDLGPSLRPAVAGSVVNSMPVLTVAAQSSKIVSTFLCTFNPRSGALGSAVLLTSDGGTTWHDILSEQLVPYTSSSCVSGLAAPAAIAIDPTDAKTLYLSLGGAVFKTIDRGNKWRQLTLRAGNISDITVNSKSSKIMYVASESGVWTSEDGGTTWSPLRSGTWQERMKRVVSIGDLTVAQGYNGIYRLTTTTGWLDRRWKDLEQKPESDPIGYTEKRAPGTN